jgi:hypothetical protein
MLDTVGLRAPWLNVAILCHDCSSSLLGPAFPSSSQPFFFIRPRLLA